MAVCCQDLLSERGMFTRTFLVGSFCRDFPRTLNDGALLDFLQDCSCLLGGGTENCEEGLKDPEDKGKASWKNLG